MLWSPLPLESWIRILDSVLTSSQYKDENISDMIHCVYNLKTNQLFRKSAANPDHEIQTLKAVITENYT